MIITIVVCFVVIIGTKIIYDLFDKGYAHYGDAWQDTPERALLQMADDTIDSKQKLTVAHLIEKRDIEDITIMTFVSQGDTLVTVTFVKNGEEQYSVYGSTEEVWLDSPSMFLLNGDPEQFNFDSEKFIIFPYKQYNTTVWGWCYSDCSFTVNGITPAKQTYVFDCQGKTWSIDRWQIDNFPTATDVIIEYTKEQKS